MDHSHYNKRYWTQDMLVKLWICYRLGVSFKNMTLLFGKSLSAINKVLSRYNMRISLHLPEIASLDYLRTQIATGHLTLDDFNHIPPQEYHVLNAYTPWQTVNRTLLSLEQLPKHCHDKRLPLGVLHHDTWEDVLCYARQYGYQIRKRELSNGLVQEAYLVNNTWHPSRKQLLLQVNRQRSLCNLPPLVVPEMMD